MLASPISDALIEIVARLEHSEVEYCVGGSVMLALNGFDVEPGDIDIAVRGDARPAIVGMFADHIDRPRTDLWRSEWALRAEWDVGGVPVGVDVMGDLRVNVDGVEAGFPVVAGRKVLVDGHDVVLAPLRHWYHLYRMHRPEKAAMIASLLSEEEIAFGARELGIESRSFPYTDSANRE